MKTLKIFTIAIASLCLPFLIFGQTDFQFDDYAQFLQTNQNLETDQLLSQYAPIADYYNGNDANIPLDNFNYFDSVQTKYRLTESEISLLQKNSFVVTERLSYECFGRALHDIYIKDLPVLVTTDAILQALHASYDLILMDLEIYILEANLDTFLTALYNSFPSLQQQYGDNPQLQDALSDVDLYVTIARSLLSDTKLSPHFTDPSQVNTIWNAILAEQSIDIPLFSERFRHIDFSQFKPRGHYTNIFYDAGEERTLEAYFKTMMWLGRIDFMLTAPPENPWEPSWTEEEIKRMNLGAIMLNELIELSGARQSMNLNNQIIDFMVGESDNLTPDELSDIINSLNITGADDLLDDSTYDNFQTALSNSVNAGQKILSNILLMDPFSDEPGVLPVSFRVMGQRFIIDSYVFSNVVFDRIIYQQQKVWRPLPDPLDAMYVLGNNDAAHLLKNELDTYTYSSQLAALRYLVDSYDTPFWESTFYNLWLNAIRALNPESGQVNSAPFFMKTSAWHQEKLNTQLASWAQLRHDNLLYAKQSYTGGSGCSFPHSYIEPYPEFYRNIATFAERAYERISQIPIDHWRISFIKGYFPRLKNVMVKLETLAEKELNGEPFTEQETDFLKRMLFLEAMSGAPPFSGWYADLYFQPEDAAKGDFIVADVHTQPTDYNGAPVGHVLHVGVGKINLGVFLADSPSDCYQPMCFVGPVMSYYETITDNFYRLSDEEWANKVMAGDLPDRPDWVNIYLTDGAGESLPVGRELPGSVYTGSGGSTHTAPEKFELCQNFPNPFNPETTIQYSIPKNERVQLTIYDITGRKITTLIDRTQAKGSYRINWNAGQLASGIYFGKIQAGEFREVIKMMLVK